MSEAARSQLDGGKSAPDAGWRAPEVLARNVYALDARPRAGDVRHALQMVTRLPATPEFAARYAVLANLVGVIGDGSAEDYEGVAALAAELGHQQLAALQNELDARVGSGLNVSFAGEAIIRLSGTTHIKRLLLDAGRPAGVAHQVATGCADAAFWLLMADIDPANRAPMPGSPEELRLIVERRGADGWRRILGNVAQRPWGLGPMHLADLARDAGLEAAARAVERCAEVYRERIDTADRRAVAREIRRLVAVSGCSQREFASRVGTSAPRLSTYVTGGVTPSAAMMLRITRASSVLAERRTAVRRRRC